MASTTSFASSTDSSPDHAVTVWHRAGEFFLHRRVRITAIVFVALILEDVLEGLRPHGLENFRDGKSMIGLGLVLGGLALRTWAAGILHKKSQLTTSGPYGVVRHPLYIGSYLMMLGFCSLIDDTENIWFVLGPILILYLYRALSEERLLSDKFGPKWDAYAKSVPRFFPRTLPADALSDWNVNQWAKNGEYNAVAAVLFSLAAIEIWHLS